MASYKSVYTVDRERRGDRGEREGRKRKTRVESKSVYRQRKTGRQRGKRGEKEEDKGGEN